MKGFISLDDFFLEEELLNKNHKLLEEELDFDYDFLKRAETVKSLNFEAKDFTTLKYKKEIRYLINKHFFDSFKGDFLKTLDKGSNDQINSLISEIKKFNKFNSVYKLLSASFGAGECLLYYLIDDVILGGESKSFDITSGTDTFEVKAASISKNNFAYNFRMGGTFSTRKIENKLVELANKSGIKKDKEINISDIKQIKTKEPKEWEALEKEFVKIAYDNYFSKHTMIFFNHSDSKKKRGFIEKIKDVKREDIFLGRYTSNVLKPQIKL